METLLYLAHRIPFPPNKGDKIRSFNLLKHLAGRYRIRLGCFIDDPADWRYLDDLDEWCAEVCARPLKPRSARIASLRGLCSGEALTLPYYRDAGMASWVRRCLDEGVDRVVVFSSAMAQYLTQDDHATHHVVVDFVDVDSDKWRQYAGSHRFPMNRLYRREADRLLAFERAAAARAAAAVFVSEEEAALFRQLAPEVAQRTHAIDNGVDVEYFSLERSYPNPYAADERHLVFTGAMDYWANVDAVCWFAEHVFPRVRAARPDAHFTIVGARPAPQVLRLGQQPGVHVTGAVHDVRPYQAHAALAVAPLRIARGVQNKVLEAMAMALAVVATPQALDGLRTCSGLDWQVSEEPESVAAMILALLADPAAAARLGAEGRRCVCTHYSWSEHMDRFVALLESPYDAGLSDSAARKTG